MLIKNYEAIEIYTKLNEILKKYSFRAKVCQSLIENKNKLKSVVEIFEEARTNILENLAKKDENGNLIIEDNNYLIEDKKTLYGQINELQGNETDIEFAIIPLEDIGDIEINGADYEALFYFVK